MQKRVHTAYILLLLGAFGAGFLLSRSVEREVVLGAPIEQPEGVDFAPLWKAWQLLEEKYVPATSSAVALPQDRVWGAIEGLAKSYDDPYTTFLPPALAKEFDEDIRGTFGGVGFEVGMRDDLITVIAPLKGTPAERAGIQAGDVLVAIDGVSTHELSIDKAVRMIRGPVGSPVVLTVARKGEGEFLELSIVRDEIEIPTIDTEIRNGVYIISLYNFGATSHVRMREAMREYVQSGATKLILDLRGNPGGYLESAVDIASWFLPLGKVIVTEDFGERAPSLVHRSKGYDILSKEDKLVVLVDGGSASASEIVAGALREHKRAVLIGEQTFGKGSVQELVSVTEDTSLKITVAQWRTPLGVSISENGLTPDAVVVRTATDREEERDPHMDAALTYMETGLLPVATSTASK